MDIKFNHKKWCNEKSSQKQKEETMMADMTSDRNHLWQPQITEYHLVFSLGCKVEWMVRIDVSLIFALGDYRQASRKVKKEGALNRNMITRTNVVTKEKIDVSDKGTVWNQVKQRLKKCHVKDKDYYRLQVCRWDDVLPSRSTFIVCYLNVYTRLPYFQCCFSSLAVNLIELPFSPTTADFKYKDIQTISSSTLHF